MILAKDRQALVKIHIGASEVDDTSSCTRYAATELRWYLGRITAAVFEIVPYADEAGIFLVPAEGEEAEKLGDEGFHTCITDSKLTITGGKRGLIYGVYDFLESLGCRFFTHNCEKIPTIDPLDAAQADFTKKPRMEYREHNYADAVQYPRFSVKCRFNGNRHNIPSHMGGHITYAWFVHTFDKMVPVAVYGKEHPEYYALVDGVRLNKDGRQSQLCLTNPDVLKIATESVRKGLLEHPESKIISISQNDWKEHCQCEKCRAVDKEEDSPAGTLMRFVNTIAEALEPEFPDVTFDTLAYEYTRKPPKLTLNRKNVCVRICSIECCFAHPFEKCTYQRFPATNVDGSPAVFIDDLRGWAAVCDRMYIWDYVTCFASYASPFPNWRVLQPNIQTMAANHVVGVFEQANGASRGGVDFNELRLYLISKLLWDPDCDLAQHRREFLEYYYGAAANALDRYLDALCDVMEEENIHSNIFDKPDAEYFREDLLDKYDALFDEAAAAVSGDALRLFRVEKARLSVRWVRLKRKAMLRGEYDAAEIEKFTADWRAFGLSDIEEWSRIQTSHRAFIAGKWRGCEFFKHWTDEEPEVM